MKFTKPYSYPSKGKVHILWEKPLHHFIPRYVALCGVEGREETEWPATCKNCLALMERRKAKEG